MISISNFKKLSFLVYGLGVTGKSVVNFFERNNLKNYKVWDDNNKTLLKKKRPKNLNKTLKNVNYIVLSPGISLDNLKKKNDLINYKKKIITDIDLIYLLKKFNKSIVVTGTNGKSTTCKILLHVLKKNNYKTLLGGNIGTPILDLKIKKDNILVIEASSFQLAYSKFICPDYALLLNITNDHLDWHKNMSNYVNAKFKIFKLQRKNHFSLINDKLKFDFKKRDLKGKLIIPDSNKYRNFKSQIKNSYLKSKINDENMSYIFALSKIFRISENSLLKSLSSFKGLPHRYEIFLKKKNFVFINDSKATSFEATKNALKNTKNIHWIVGGLPKKNDKISLTNLKKNILKIYIIGKNTNFFKKQINTKIEHKVTRDIKNSLIEILKNTRLYGNKNISILFSPAAASFDQYLNFEKRGDQFKKLSRIYARKYI
tara:strand:+ start:9162 stop:10448 length:1287 start_codon:yes stop_codon:yes gene_type:complete